MCQDNRKIQLRLVPGDSVYKVLQYRLYPKTWFGRLFRPWKFLLYYDYAEWWNIFGAKCGDYLWCRLAVPPEQWDDIKESFQTLQDIKAFQKEQKRKEYEIKKRIVY